MTDREQLFTYRIDQAKETLIEIEKMLAGGFSARTIVNRAYYALFYATLALFLRLDIDCQTSKHAGVISIFDRELVRSGKMEPRFSRMLHRLFELRQKADYKELIEITMEDAISAATFAREFIAAAQTIIGTG